MRLAALLSTLTQEPLLITPAAHAALLTLFEQHAQLDAEEFRAAREGKDLCGRSVELEQAELVEGVMVIPIGGPIGRGLGPFEKGAGAVGVEDVLDELARMEGEPECIGAVLDIDSPGGMVAGTPELADAIRACDKPVYAFSAGSMASAAYWVATACSQVFATKSSDVGNVGVMCYLLDHSKRYAAAGVKPELIVSGRYKGLGAPGTSLTKDHREHLQARVDTMFEMFASHLEEVRPGMSRELMQGQVFKGQEAVGLGVIDGLAADVYQVIDRLREDAGADGIR